MSITADYSYLTALKIVHDMNCSMSALPPKATLNAFIQMSA